MRYVQRRVAICRVTQVKYRGIYTKQYFGYGKYRSLDANEPRIPRAVTPISYSPIIVRATPTFTVREIHTMRDKRKEKYSLAHGYSLSSVSACRRLRSIEEDSFADVRK